MSESLLPSWEYLETLPGVEFYKLYRSPPSALAIYRKRLSNLAKSFVMTLLYMPRPLPSRDLELFVQPTSSRELRHALDLLNRYHILRTSTAGSGRHHSLTPDFAKSLRQALVGASDNNTFGQVATNVFNDSVTIESLDQYARKQWEGILGYMVGSTAADTGADESPPVPKVGVIEILKAGHLIELSGAVVRTARPEITKEGFAFVLQDVNTQIWALLFLYVDNSEAFGLDKVDVLSAIFLVASLELGQAYSWQSLSQTQQQVLQDLSALGIVFQPTLSDGSAADYFYPTRLATTLTSDSSSVLSATNSTLGSSLSTSNDNSSASQGFIIVETNYRVYAYTSSPLQVALLSLFVTLRSRHPNLVTGKMTKLSVQRAVRKGITAEQIISYLGSHAHPQMRRHAQAERARNNDQNKSVPLLPATVIDQIHLWQLERDRMSTTSGFLLQEFRSQAEYEKICKYADETGVLVWKNDKKRIFFVNNIKGVQSFMADKGET